MPLKKLQLKSGVNRENTRYTTEGGWYDCDKIRFRQGTPEKIGGWERVSENTFLGVCRSLFRWSTLDGLVYTGVGTHLKFYVAYEGEYNDVTPVRATTGLTNPFTTANGDSVVTVADAVTGGIQPGDFVIFSGASAVGGLTIDGEYQIISVDFTGNSYTIDAGSAATSTATGGGAVTAQYQINTGAEVAVPLSGWGASTWGAGTWGVGSTSSVALRRWSQSNFGEDLIFGPRGGGIFYWAASTGVGTRAVNLATVSGATAVPTVQNFVLVSDISRFVFALGCNDIGSGTADFMLVRWSDQEDPYNWSPSATNQAGSLRLSRGSQIVTAAQARQEVLVWTDAALYSLQYVGAPVVWGAQLVGENISIASQNAVAYANGVAFWMGVDKFYKYDGTTQTLRCDLRQFVFNNINRSQLSQVFAGTNEAFNEVWWFYCNGNSESINRYVVYNYVEDVWYYGTMARTAWHDSGLASYSYIPEHNYGSYPLAAGYNYNLINHELGVDDAETGTTLPIESYITSSEFDLDDGHQFAFVWRVLPDITFRGSDPDNSSPSVTFTLYPLTNSGSGYNDPASVGGVNYASVTRTVSQPVEEFTGQIFTRLRGRQLAMKVSSTDLGVAWQLGSPRVDMRPDGRR